MVKTVCASKLVKGHRDVSLAPLRRRAFSVRLRLPNKKHTEVGIAPRVVTFSAVDLPGSTHDSKHYAVGNKIDSSGSAFYVNEKLMYC